MKRVSKKQENNKMNNLNSKVFNKKSGLKRKSLKRNSKSRNNNKKRKQRSLIRKKNVKQNKKRKTRRIRKQKGGYTQSTPASCPTTEQSNADIFQSSFEHRPPVLENNVNVRDSYSFAFKNSLGKLIFGRD
tara:strand:- start:313 stop:705 length:393 start_codon:yes stop_codon:yes gene_type:complete